MPESTRVKVEGLRELGLELKNLKEDVALKIVRQVMSQAARVVRDQAQRLAPEADKPHGLSVRTKGDKAIVQPGNLRKNIVSKKIKSNLTVEYIVTVRGKRKDNYAARYGRLQEFGTVQHSPQPFLKPAFEAKKQEVLDSVIKPGLRKRIEKAKRQGGK